jgi:signal transduction histidine kinase
MSSRYGTLFLVNTEEDHILPIYELISVQGFGGEQLSLGSFEIDSPVAAWLAEERRPLAQYDIDILPRFSNISAMEHEWLAGLEIEVYVPIHHDEKWIGLLGLGPKQSNDRYFENDLMLLATLADQTAVALENARLLTDLVKLNRDLVQTKQTLLVTNEQLNASDKLKSAFIGVITHEMRTPFANINFSLELVRQTGTGNFPPDQQDAFERVEQGVQVASQMVDNLVTYASYLSKQRPLRPQSFDFASMVDEQLITLRQLARNRNISIDLLQPKNVFVVADSELLGDAVYHLVHNAVKFTADNGHIWVRSWMDADEVHFEVQDDGIGIPTAELDNLWRDFSQMADPLRRGVEGLGLGLPLVKHIVSEHGGTVQANSEAGAGAMFGFIIPAR